MNTLIRILALSAVIALTGCSQTDARPELLSEWSDKLLADEIIVYEDTIMDYHDAITALQDEQKRRASPEKVY
jgi:hypothetical protein